MARARARQTNNRVSMEAATTLDGRRRALVARGKGDLATMRSALREADKGADKAIVVATLRRIAKEHGPVAYKSALKLINPTYLGMDVIPENIANGPKPKR